MATLATVGIACIEDTADVRLTIGVTDCRSGILSSAVFFGDSMEGTQLAGEEMSQLDEVPERVTMLVIVLEDVTDDTVDSEAALDVVVSGFEYTVTGTTAKVATASYDLNEEILDFDTLSPAEDLTRAYVLLEVIVGSVNEGKAASDSTIKPELDTIDCPSPRSLFVVTTNGSPTPLVAVASTKGKTVNELALEYLGVGGARGTPRVVLNEVPLPQYGPMVATGKVVLDFSSRGFGSASTG